MKITSKKVQKTIIEISTQEILKNVRACVDDLIWDDRPREIDNPTGARDSREQMKNHCDFLYEANVALVMGDGDKIRSIFKDGSTMFMLGEAFKVVEDCTTNHLPVEVIVTDHFDRKHIVSEEHLEF